ncbi:MAG: hypothetical protein HYW47_04100 [Deltaproteobacteria bacterium]|nr:hypothetical protein [Deltaproteobacteria bacterium]
MTIEKYLKLKFLVFLLFVPLAVPAAGLLYFKTPLVKNIKTKIRKQSLVLQGEYNNFEKNIKNIKPLNTVVDSVDHYALARVYRVRNNFELGYLQKSLDHLTPQTIVATTQTSPQSTDQTPLVVATQNLENKKTFLPQVVTQKAQWIISGQVIDYNRDTNDVGHFEVGLYDDVGSDGLPKPTSRLLAHHILEKGVSRFSFMFSKKVQGHLVARYFSDKKSPKTGESYPLRTTAVYSANPVNLEEDLKNVYLFIGQHKPKSYALSGRVLNGYSSLNPYTTPAPHVELRLEGTDIILKTNLEGFYYIDELYYFDGYLEILNNKEVVQRVPLYMDTSRYVDVALVDRKENTNQLHGQVLDKFGFPLKGVRLVLKESGEESLSSQEGIFTFSFVQEGMWTLEAYAGQEFIGFIRFSHKEGIVTELVLQEKSPIYLKGKVLKTSLVRNENEGGVTQVQVRVAGYPVQTQTNEEGSFSLGPIATFQDFVELELEHPEYFLGNIKYKPSLSFVYLPSLFSLEDQKLPLPLNPQAGNLWADFSFFNEELRVYTTNNVSFNFYMRERGIDFLSQNTDVKGHHRMSFLNIPQGEEVISFYSKDGFFRGLTTLYFPPGYATLFLP